MPIHFDTKPWQSQEDRIASLEAKIKLLEDLLSSIHLNIERLFQSFKENP